MNKGTHKIVNREQYKKNNIASKLLPKYAHLSYFRTSFLWSCASKLSFKLKFKKEQGWLTAGWKKVNKYLPQQVSWNIINKYPISTIRHPFIFFSLSLNFIKRLSSFFFNSKNGAPCFSYLHVYIFLGVFI